MTKLYLIFCSLILIKINAMELDSQSSHSSWATQFIAAENCFCNSIFSYQRQMALKFLEHIAYHSPHEIIKTKGAYRAGRAYSGDRDIEQDHKKAYDFFLIAYQSQDIDTKTKAAWRIGEFLYKGLGVAQDMQSAKIFFLAGLSEGADPWTQSYCCWWLAKIAIHNNDTKNARHYLAPLKDDSTMPTLQWEAQQELAKLSP